jgi:hypothetical protein
MKNILSSLCLLSFMAAPVFAQTPYQGAPTVIYSKMTVDSWGPQHGSTGTEITIRGSGFSESTELYFGGEILRPSILLRGEIVFRVPKRFTNGQIILRKPGRPDLVVGEFKIDAPPIVHHLVPAYGVPGSRVEIRGRGFAPDAQVFMNNRPVMILTVTDRAITVEIPVGAQSDYLTVVNGGGARARSPRTFEVTLPAPRVLALEPSSGAPGQTVRVRGQFFSDRDRVFYGQFELPVLGRGPDWVDVTIPNHIRTNDFIFINGPGGSGQSAQRFVLAFHPIITRLSTYRALPGTEIEIQGQNFHERMWVEIGGASARIRTLTRDRVTVIVPRGARSGLVYLIDGPRRYPSPQPLEIGSSMQIASWGPWQGPPGTLVTLRGIELDGSRVYYGDVLLPLEPAPFGELKVRIPARARDAHLRVVGRYGEVTTDRPFRVMTQRLVIDSTTDRARWGQEISIRGSGFTNGTRAFFGDTEMQVTRVSPDGNQIFAIVPQGVRGREFVYVESRKGRARSPELMMVLMPRRPRPYF